MTDRALDGKETEPVVDQTEPAVKETEPDARYTLANERTFLAWNRTALALIVAGLAITQLLPPFAGIPEGRRIVGVPLIVLGAVLAFVSYLQWVRNQRALRRGEAPPHSGLPPILALVIALAAIAAVIFVLVSDAPRL